MSKLASTTLGAVALVTAMGLAPAMAGECPADQVVAGSMNGDGHMEGKGVTDTVLAAVHLGDQYPELAGRDQRIRHLTVEPGGEVGWHSHADRPAMIYITEGAITEYASTCGVPIEHRAGEVAAESGKLEHWWKNNSGQVAKLVSVDLPRTE